MRLLPVDGRPEARPTVGSYAGSRQRFTNSGGGEKPGSIGRITTSGKITVYRHFSIDGPTGD
jgi:hypothetical protein